MKFLCLLLTLLPLGADQIRDYWFNAAEISTFNLSQSRYGKNHPGHAEFIFVTERFLPGIQVKDESGKGGSIPVLKLNALRTFNTGIYSYRTMTSTFRPIDFMQFPTALKSTTSIQDWCGQAFQQFNFRDSGWAVEIRSYFEDTADRNFTLPPAPLEDELWITLRLDPGKLPVGKIKIIPGSVLSRFTHQPVSPENAVAALTTSGEISTYSVLYPELERSLEISFDTEFPYIIRKWTEATPTGTSTAILSKRVMNIPYWQMHEPQDAEKRHALGLSPIAR